MEEDEIKEALSDYRVTKVLKKQFHNKETNQKECSGALVLTFDRENLPSEIKLGYLHLHVKQYEPNPKMCFKNGVHRAAR